MSITNQEVLDLTPHSGRFRARFKYTFNDGRVAIRGPMFVADSNYADSKLADMAPDVLIAMQKQDASEAVGLGKLESHKQATLAQVQYQFIREGFDSSEPYKAYLKMKDVAPALLSLGYTNEQYAVALNTTVEDVEGARARWEELEVNAVTLAAYAEIN